MVQGQQQRKRGGKRGEVISISKRFITPCCFSRYVLQGSKWKPKTLTYKITKYPGTGVTDAEVDTTLATAFKMWSDVTDLSFVRETDSG